MTKKLQSTRATLDALFAESARFTQLAKDLALSVLQNPGHHANPEKTRVLKEHLIRAETYKDATRLVVP